MQPLITRACAAAQQCCTRVSSAASLSRHRYFLVSSESKLGRPSTAVPKVCLNLSTNNVARCMTSATTEDGSQKDIKDKNDIEHNKSVARALTKSKCPSTGPPLQSPAGLLFQNDSIVDLARQQKHFELEQLLPKDSHNLTEVVKPPTSEFFIPQVKLHEGDGAARKRVLV